MSNVKNYIFYLTITSVYFYSTKTYLKGPGHLKIKVKVTQYHGQMKENWFSDNCKCFCDLCYADSMSLTERHSCISLCLLFCNARYALIFYNITANTICGDDLQLMEMEHVICRRLALTEDLACVLRKHDYLQKGTNVGISLKAQAILEQLNAVAKRLMWEQKSQTIIEAPSSVLCCWKLLNAQIQIEQQGMLSLEITHKCLQFLIKEFYA